MRFLRESGFWCTLGEHQEQPPRVCRACVLQGRLEEAIDLYQQALRLTPSWPWPTATRPLPAARGLADGFPYLAVANQYIAGGVSILINDGKWVP